MEPMERIVRIRDGEDRQSSMADRRKLLRRLKMKHISPHPEGYQVRISFKSGPLAKIQCEWPCPKCHGEGKFTLHLWDRILLAIANKLNDVHWKYKIS